MAIASRTSSARPIRHRNAAGVSPACIRIHNSSRLRHHSPLPGFSMAPFPHSRPRHSQPREFNTALCQLKR
jgi:hypothetical protein